MLKKIENPLPVFFWHLPYNTVKRTKIVNKLFDEANHGLNIEDFFSGANSKNNSLLLRCYSVSLLEEAYNLILEN